MDEHLSTAVSGEDSLWFLIIRLMIAAHVSKIYGVSEKAVRDIWTGRTWSKETWHLDASRSRPLKKMGRPVGRQDTKPRK